MPSGRQTGLPGHAPEVEQAPSVQTDRSKAKSKLQTFGLIAVLLITVVAYSPVLFDFFIGDDFVHLIWLEKAMSDPGLILKNFYSNWLDVTTTSFYRPMISVFMASDYLLWRTNGLGFHITNLLFHLIAVFCVFKVSSYLLDETLHASSDRPAQEGDRTVQSLYPLAAASIFALYPLHPEAVSWITGRVDAIVTAFMMLSLMFYIRWRRSENRQLRLFSAITCGFMMIFALLSKEMAVILPPVFVLYELLIAAQPVARFKRLLATAPYWCLLVAYFIARRLALGTFVGGYDNNLAISDWSFYIQQCLHGLRMFLVPINRMIIDPHHPLTYTFIATLIVVAAVVVANVIRERKLWRLLVFNLLFLLGAFVPVYKVFAIANDLQGSRLGHVATVAISMLLAMAFIRVAKSRTDRAFHAIAAPYIALCFFALWTNNQAWASAGHTANAVRAGLDRIYRTIEGDPQVVLLNLPDNIDGAFVCRNALDGMTKAPQLYRNIEHCLMIEPADRVIPFGFMKESLRKARDQVHIYRWQLREKTFLKVEIPEGLDTPSTVTWEKDDLTGALAASADSNETIFDPGRRNCYDVDFITVGLKSEQASLKNLKLQFSNNAFPKFSNTMRVPARKLSNTSLVFPLRSLTDWSFGGTSGSLKFQSSEKTRLMEFDSIAITPARDMMPSIDFANSGFLGTKGYLHLSKLKPEGTVHIDGTSVAGTAKTEFVIASANKVFLTANSSTQSPNIMKRVRGTAVQDVVLNRSMFPGDGIYPARSWCLDETNKTIGVAGDHIIIYVNTTCECYRCKQARPAD